MISFLEFPFCLANGRNRGNCISDILFDGVKASGPNQVKEGVLKFFEGHFANVKWKRPRIRGLNLKQILKWESSLMESTFSL